MTLLDYVRKHYYHQFNYSQYPYPIKTRSVKKGSTIYWNGDLSRKMYFLNEGIVETIISTDDVAKTLSFIFENNFFGPFASILTQTPTILSGVAITDCIYEEFDYGEYLDFCKTSLIANRIGREELSKYYLLKFSRESAFLTKSKEEMYSLLLHQSPQIMQHIPLKKIANYLGIQPETLSRIRKKVIS